MYNKTMDGTERNRKSRKNGGLRKLAAALIALLILACVPVPSFYKDGGTADFRALAYRYIRWNRMDAAGEGIPQYHASGDYSASSFWLFFRPEWRMTVDELWKLEKQTARFARWQSEALSDAYIYTTEAYVELSQNRSEFTKYERESRTSPFEEYSPFDGLGRPGTAFACIGPESLPDDERGSIGMIRPAGWTYGGKSNNNKYSFVDGHYVYNRCHLIAYSLTGNNSEQNLITGTRSLNLTMRQFETQTVRYIEKTGNRVLYRVTPVYLGGEPLCRGVIIEALSLRPDEGGLEFCVFIPNREEGVFIDYSTGQNWAEKPE